MEPQNRDPLARERARKRRAKQIQRRRVVLGVCVLGLIILIVALAVGLSGDGTAGTTASSTTTESTENSGSTSTSEGTGGSTATSGGAPASATFKAQLTGDQSVPPVETEASATLTMEYDADKGELKYVLEVVSPLTKPSSAAIHEGAAGGSGATVVTLFAGPAKTGSFSGVLAEGFIEENDLTGSLEGGKLQDLVTLLASGNSYVSIGNASHPVDAIRGQIE